MSEAKVDVDAAWRDFADRIKAAGASITGEGFPDDPRLRAEGYRYVGRLTNLAHQLYLEFADTDRPSLFRYGDDVTPFGATNTDNNYCRAFVDPAGTYRVSGDISGVKELLISVHDGEMVLGKTAVLAEVSLGDLVVGDDGVLELIVGGPKRTRNWIPLAADAVYLNVRQFVADWEHDAIASLHIERIDGIGPVAAVSPASIADALERAATFVEASVRFWNQYSHGLRAALPTNQFTPPRLPEGGAVNMLHGAARWELEPHQALVIEFDQPEATYWSIQTYMLGWLQPLDFAHLVTSLNDSQLHVDDDGKVRIVLAQGDPGVQNWLDTSGLREGLVSYRYVRPTKHPAPIASLVDLAAVSAQLPRTTPRWKDEDRRAQLEARKRGVARRFRR